MGRRYYILGTTSPRGPKEVLIRRENGLQFAHFGITAYRSIEAKASPEIAVAIIGETTIPYVDGDPLKFPPVQLQTDLQPFMLHLPLSQLQLFSQAFILQPARSEQVQ